MWKTYLNFVLGGLSVVLIIGGIFWFFLIDMTPEAALAVVGGLFSLFGWFQTREDKKDQAKDKEETINTVIHDGYMTREAIAGEHDMTRKQISDQLKVLQDNQSNIRSSSTSKSGNNSINQGWGKSFMKPDNSSDLSLKELDIIVEQALGLMRDYSTGVEYKKSESWRQQRELEYTEKRQQILDFSDNEIQDLIPRIIKVNTSLASVKNTMHTKFDNYQERRQYLQEEFALLLKYLEELV